MLSIGRLPKGSTFSKAFGYDPKTGELVSGNKKTLEDVQKNKERVEKALGAVPTAFEISMMGKKRKK